MKHFILFILSVLSASAFAQDYIKVQYENSSFRDWSMEEMSDRLGENKALLPHYACNDRDELNPFQEPLRKNAEKNSLRIQAYKSEDYIIYKQGHYFERDGSEVTEFSDVFYKYVVSALAEFEKLEPTKKLLRMLEESYFPLTIRFGNNSFIPTVEGGKSYQGIYMASSISYFSKLRMPDDSLPFFDIGVGGFISWHPKLKVETIESDGVTRELNPVVALAHEMFHSFDSIRGLLDLRFVTGENYENQLASEYRAVYFENMVREELGINFRKYYSGTEGADLLDDNNRPILIPAPCLN